jgi:hypothetical protein
MVSFICEYEGFVMYDLYGWFNCVYVGIRVAFVLIYLNKW